MKKVYIIQNLLIITQFCGVCFKLSNLRKVRRHRFFCISYINLRKYLFTLIIILINNNLFSNRITVLNDLVPTFHHMHFLINCRHKCNMCITYFTLKQEMLCKRAKQSVIQPNLPIQRHKSEKIKLYWLNYGNSPVHNILIV